MSLTTNKDYCYNQQKKFSLGMEKKCLSVKREGNLYVKYRLRPRRLFVDCIFWSPHS